MHKAFIFFLLALTFSAHGPTPQVGPEKSQGLAGFTLFLVGDSTMANKPVIPANPERGWGQMLPLYVSPAVRIQNYARNGRSSKSFRDEGLWSQLLAQLKAGDHVIIQFGHNDQKTNGAGRISDPFGSFKENLQRYVRETREKGGVPVLATPIARRRFNKEGQFLDTHGDYPAAVRNVAEEMQVPLLDLHARTSELVGKLGPESSKKLFNYAAAGEYAKYPDGLKDDTHLSSIGAARVCDLAVEELITKVPFLAKHLKRDGE